MSDRPDRAGGPTASLRDPIVPLDFSGWARRVFRVFRQSFVQVGTLALLPIAVVALYLVAMSLVVPTPDELREKFTAAAASSPTGTVSSSDQFWIVYGGVIPVVLVFAVLLIAAGSVFHTTAYYTSLRAANGQPTSLPDALRAVRGRVLPFTGWWLLAGLITVGVVFVALVFQYLNPLGALNAACSLLVLAVLVGLHTIIQPALSGAVLVERAGLGRCFALVKHRFWATLGRMLLTWLAYTGVLLAFLLTVWLVTGSSGAVTLSGVERIVIGVVVLVMAIPALVFSVAVTLVSYAELRFHENRATTTRSLAAEISR